MEYDIELLKVSANLVVIFGLCTTATKYVKIIVAVSKQITAIYIFSGNEIDHD